MKSVWGHDIGKLKYTYEKDYEEKPVEKNTNDQRRI